MSKNVNGKWAKPSRPADMEPVIRGGAVSKLLYDLLVRATPHGHEDKLKDLMPKGAETDACGNMIYRIGRAKEHKTMFSSHMDTVQRGTDLRRLVHDKSCFVYATNADGSPSVLGADDKIGMYIMLRMMEKKIPGMYVFHVGEECGGIGSEWLVKNNPKYFTHIDRCVAFDRMDYSSVITAQHGVCCSDEFADALCDELNKGMPAYCKFEPDNTGVFTDSENYVGLIGECTNLSVGYFNQHTTSEHFDPIWLESTFLPIVLGLDWSALPTVREPEARATYSYSGNYHSSSSGKHDPWAYISEWSQEASIPCLKPSQDTPRKHEKALLIGLKKHFMDVTPDEFFKEVLGVMQERDIWWADVQELKAEKEAMSEFELWHNYYNDNRV